MTKRKPKILTRDEQQNICHASFLEYSSVKQLAEAYDVTVRTIKLILDGKYDNLKEYKDGE